MPRQPVQPASTIEIQYVSLDELRKWPTNPKNHDLGAIAASMIRFGFRDPLGVNGNNHFIEEGHGRLDTLTSLKRQQRPAPQYITVAENGDWLVPVLFFDDDEETQRGYSLAHNRTHDLGGGYDDAKLLEELESQQHIGLLQGTGFDDDDVDALRRKLSAGANDSPDNMQRLNASFQILITCRDEAHQLELIEQFSGQGLDVRAMVS